MHPPNAGTFWAMEVARAHGTQLWAGRDADPGWILDVAQGLRLLG